MNQTRKYLLLGSLYIVQSVPFSFLKSGFQVFLTNLEWSLADTGKVTGLLMLPWVIKFLWAPLVDRWCGNNMPRIRYSLLLFQVIGAAILGVIASLNFPEGLNWIILLFFILSLVAATQDIFIDAFAVLTLPKSEHGLGNSTQIGGYYLGEVLGGAVILIISDFFGWNWAIWAFMIFFLLPFFPVLFYFNKIQPMQARVAAGTGLSPVKSFFKQPGIIMWLVVMGIYMSNQVLARTMLPAMLTTMKYSESFIGNIIIIGNSASLAGALLGGAVINRLGRKKSLVYFGVLKVVTFLLFLLLADKAASPTEVYLAIIPNDFVSGLTTVTLFTIIMDKCRLSSPGTDFTIQQCINQTAILVFVVLSGILGAKNPGNFNLVFITAIVLAIVGVLTAVFGLTRVSLDGDKSSKSLF